MQNADPSADSIREGPGLMKSGDTAFHGNLHGARTPGFSLRKSSARAGGKQEERSQQHSFIASDGCADPG